MIITFNTSLNKIIIVCVLFFAASVSLGKTAIMQFNQLTRKVIFSVNMFAGNKLVCSNFQNNAALFLLSKMQIRVIPSIFLIFLKN